jgi:phosphonate transport system substrate-binding protein
VKAAVANVTPIGTRRDQRSMRFALPPSVGMPAASERARRLETYLTKSFGRPVEVVVSPSYEALARELLTGKSDAGWAPPFVCARIEAMGVRVLLRGIRHGASSYRSALVCKADVALTLEQLKGATAAWTDRDSVGGYLLAMAYLRSKGMDPTRLFAGQTFEGSYQAALEAVLSGKAQVTSVFAPVAVPGKPDTTGLSELMPGKANQFRVVAFTEDAPNDGVAVSMSVTTPVVAELEKTLLALSDSPEGSALLKEAFNAEKFEVAPRMGYRALYRVALASL